MKYRSQAISRKHATGFSLVELMITLVLATLLISALILTYLSGRVAAGDAELLSRAQENVRIVSEYLVRDIRNAGYTDEVETTIGQDALLRRSFGAIENGDKLRIRYVGRGHCGANFEDFVLVENEYFVEIREGVGFLRCRGRHVLRTASIDTDTTWDGDDLNGVKVLQEERVVDLVSGVASIEFSEISQNTNSCGWDYSPTGIQSACLGVEIELGLTGVSGDVRTVTLQAAFRNVILERINNNIAAP